MKGGGVYRAVVLLSLLAWAAIVQALPPAQNAASATLTSPAA